MEIIVMDYMEIMNHLQVLENTGSKKEEKEGQTEWKEEVNLKSSSQKFRGFQLFLSSHRWFL
jgi:hypothetical protein